MRLAEIPVNVTVELMEAAVGAAANVIACVPPGERVGVAGVVVTPVGRPVMVTATVPVKELIGLAVMLT